ncbi:hypothetical protein FHS83_002126 [Rhizomicrobium palustre]|uniref:Uncharacterized protein n=1 Tax=Rhizomicrobium palustre TaxID=189966 RepID=A0A846MYU8_9PROT|nr:hypothetical protein [Rhizomicrobium palustre]NIK88808.1 hypothetical protein [Rhizomicrobium palustre]
MRKTIFALLAFLALTGPAFAQSGGQMGSSATGWSALPANASCQQMKEQLDAVMGSGESRSGSADTGAVNPNNSGITARTREARHHIALGDKACEAGDKAGARDHYRQAYESFMSNQ